MFRYKHKKIDRTKNHSFLKTRRHAAFYDEHIEELYNDPKLNRRIDSNCEKIKR
jgi:hypothetical protein